MVSDMKATLKWSNLDEAFGALEKTLGEVARGITVSAWKSVLRESPQFDGRMVASWTYSISRPIFEDRSFMVETLFHDKLNPFEKGDAPAIRVANQANAGTDLQFRLGDKVYLSNGVNHGEGSYSGRIESGDIHLRAVNYPGKPVAETLMMIKARYADGVNARQAARLKNLSITGASHAD